MWSDMVILVPPYIYFIPGFIHRSKPIQVQAFILELAIKALKKRILSRLTWLYKPWPQLRLFALEEHRFASEFSAIIANYFVRLRT